MHPEIILKKLDTIEKLIENQSLFQMDVFNLKQAAQYLDISESHLYKLTSTKRIPHYCPQGKKLYFKRSELDEWLLSNRQSSTSDIEKEAANYVLLNKRSKR